MDLINVQENKREKCHLKENNEFECNDDLHLTSRDRDIRHKKMSALMNRN
mgnify:CR=1 FL=1